MVYMPEPGDVVDINCEPACEGEVKYHSIRPLANKLRGIVMNTEAGHVDDHLCHVRFYGPEWAQFEQRPNAGIRMYFKKNELRLVRRGARR